ncbi:hypothetical protein ACT453_50465, partial [Bacillus sp. D-CC]
LSWFTKSATQESVQATKQNIIQSGAFSPYETPDVTGALTSLKMTAKFILKPVGSEMKYVNLSGFKMNLAVIFKDVNAPVTSGVSPYETP